MNNFKLIRPEEIKQTDYEFLTSNAANWYETPGHSMLYSHEPPQWVAIWYNSKTDPICFCCFSEIDKLIHLKGPSTATDAMLKMLVKHFKNYALLNPYQQPVNNKRKEPYWIGKYYKSHSDWIVDLPDSFEGYIDNLGKTTKKHVKKYIKRFEKEVINQFIVYKKSEITSELLTEFFGLHQLRMDISGKEFLLTDDKIERRLKLAKETGVFCGIWTDGKLIAGTLNFGHGNTYYLSTVSHHPDYDRYHAGLLAVVNTVRYFISLKVERYNLHIRYSPFKTRLGGKENNHYDRIYFANTYGALWWYLQQLKSKIKRKQISP